MDMLLIVFGSLLAASGTVPYVIATVKRQTKPRLVTWATWALLTGLASASAFSDGKLAGGIFALLGALSTGAIVVAGLRYGDRSLEKLDIICLGGVAAGFVLWPLLHSPAVGVLAAIIIDFVGLVPTVRHAWEEPGEETWITYALVGVGGSLAVLPVFLHQTLTVTSIGYPVYAAVSLGSLAVVIVSRRRWQQRLVPVPVKIDE
jgi:hypothetical protein